MSPKGSFLITANHTGAGKTIISYLICCRYGQIYFKPVESGIIGDSALIASFGGQIKIQPPLYSYPVDAPPHFLAQQANQTISLEHILSQIPHGAFVLETAGGWFSPLNDKQTMADLAIALKVPVVAVFRTYLGGINHAVLTLQAIQLSQVPLAGYIINGQDSYGMALFLKQRFPQVRCLATLPELGTNPNPNALLPNFNLDL